MKNYETQIKQIESDLKNEFRTVEQCDANIKYGFQSYSMTLAMIDKRTELINKNHKLQIMKSKQILYNMQNGAR